MSSHSKNGAEERFIKSMMMLKPHDEKSFECFLKEVKKIPRAIVKRHYFENEVLKEKRVNPNGRSTDEVTETAISECYSITMKIYRIECLMKKICLTKSHIVPSCWACHSSFTGCLSPDYSFKISKEFGMEHKYAILISSDSFNSLASELLYELLRDTYNKQ
ncbi:MAG: hypothetical protein PHT40_04365 [Patescibacteria group bacterium]|nr:hypothetical protein [Patescibacteria group bacterium]